jgi:hypothetical protein
LAFLERFAFDLGDFFELLGDFFELLDRPDFLALRGDRERDCAQRFFSASLRAFQRRASSPITSR